MHKRATAQLKKRWEKTICTERSLVPGEAKARKKRIFHAPFSFFSLLALLLCVYFFFPLLCALLFFFWLLLLPVRFFFSFHFCFSFVIFLFLCMCVRVMQLCCRLCWNCCCVRACFFFTVLLSESIPLPSPMQRPLLSLCRPYYGSLFALGVFSLRFLFC